MPNEPTILVKKADGSFVRMPLSQVRQAAHNTPLPAPPLKGEGVKVAPKRPPYPTAPMMGTKKANNDFRSPLEEPAPAKGDAPKLSEPRLSQVDQALKKINFPVPPNFINRLRSIIQLRLKDVRSPEETKNILLRSIKDGGMGFTANQAEKAAGACEEVLLPATATPFNPFEHSEKVKTTPLPPPSKGGGGPTVPESKKKANELLHALLAPEEKPVATAPPSPPHQKFWCGGEPSPYQGEGKMTVSLRGEGATQSSSFKLGSAPVKQSMRDISAPPVEMGPIDEVKYISLTDFRRLAQNCAEAGQRLKQKFINLRDESYLLYMDAQAAWKQSPLYLEYMDAVCGALADRKTLAQTATEKGGIKIEEIKAIVAMEKEL